MNPGMNPKRIYRRELVKVGEKSKTIKISKNKYFYMEYRPQKPPTITNADMIRLHIDIALDNGDREAFDRLTKQLQEIEGSKCTQSKN